MELIHFSATEVEGTHRRIIATIRGHQILMVFRNKRVDGLYGLALRRCGIIAIDYDITGQRVRIAGVRKNFKPTFSLLDLKPLGRTWRTE
jgi:hypothetical protein